MCYGQVIGESLRKARKIHICHWCGKQIVPGTEYKRWAWVATHEAPQEVKVHQECHERWQDAISRYGSEDVCIDIGGGLEFEQEMER